MKSRSVKLLFYIIGIAGILVQGPGTPASGLSAEFRVGIVTTNLNLRKTPSLHGEIVAGLQKGSPVKVYGEKDGWYRVSSKKNYILFNGWVYKQYVKIVSSESAALSSDAKVPEIKILKPVSGTPPQKPIPAPVKKAASPSLAAPPRPDSAVPKPDNPIAEKSLKPKVAGKKIKRTGPLKTAPVPDTHAKPAGAIRLILSISPLVLAVIALLIAVRAYRATQPSSRKSKIPEVSGKTPPEDEKQPVDPKKPPVSEKRQVPRTNRLIEVDFAVDGKFHRGFINNLNETGVYIDTPVKFSVDQEIMISCPSIGTGGHVKRSGVIIRKTATGIAVRFGQDPQHKQPL